MMATRSMTSLTAPIFLNCEGRGLPSTALERFSYDDAVVRWFMGASVLWAIVGMLVGVVIALQLADPRFNLGIEWTSFGRLRPLHTNAVIFAFAGNAIFAAVYDSSQRLLKARMLSDILSWIHFWGWQSIIVAAAITLPLGFTQGKEYAQLEWPIDIAVVCVWVVFAVNFFGTLLRRRERHLYVAIWFYIATVRRPRTMSPMFAWPRVDCGRSKDFSLARAAPCARSA
jgi:cytochrome c oxidase cbb3-type subunit I/II